MASIISRLFSREPKLPPIPPGIYHMLAEHEPGLPYRLHLRMEPDGTAVLIINASIILHLNHTAAAHAYELVRGASEEDAARSVAQRYRVGYGRALQDHRSLRQQILSLAVARDLDPVVYLDMDRHEPHSKMPSAPYRLDIALTYLLDPDGRLDPLARRRVDRELSTEEWKQVLSKVWDAGVPHVAFTGGEPTRRPDLIDLIRHAQSLGLVTGLCTEGRRLSDAQYVQDLAQSGLDHILIALPPDDPAARQGLANALSSDMFTAVHLTLMPGKENALQEAARSLKAQGVRAVSLSGGPNVEPESLAKVRTLVGELDLELVWDLPAPYTAVNPIALETGIRPDAIRLTSLYVEPDGDVLPAQGIDKVLGNLVRESWADVWARAVALR